jgi:hypothetical protein
MPFTRPVRRFYLTPPKVIIFVVSVLLAILAIAAAYGHFAVFRGVNGFVILLIAYLVLAAGTLIRGL